MKIIFLFCADPLVNKLPDSIYLPETQVLDQLGIDYQLIDFEQLINHLQQPTIAVKSVTPQDNILGIYRGWMLSPKQYTNLFAALKDKGIHLINNSWQYEHCHLFPNAYNLIQPYTPKSIWIEIEKIQNIDLKEVLKIFGNQPIIIKDFVKSQKHRWKEACFIPSAADENLARKVMDKFIELQGENLIGGIVFREFIELEKIGHHNKSKMPLTKEFRVFFLYGEPIYISPYWETENEQENFTLPENLLKVGKSINSNFFTMDIAKTVNGDFIIIELGDGQVAGLPEAVKIDNFYQSLMHRIVTR
ncbi:MAG TPA: ATP-grasp domain-containing protein [Nostocaceae cyanobacterium]|nr:ATP-grasp domain-containing protein [Nostocaceae cyanobacterium]